MKPNVDLLDVVELRKAHGRQPARAIGAVVELFATEALVEIIDEEAATSDLVSVPTRTSACDPPLSRRAVERPGKESRSPSGIESIRGLADPRIEQVRVPLERDQRACVPGNRLHQLYVGARGDES
jgi:hypothetical protein